MIVSGRRAKEGPMKLCVATPLVDIGGDPDTVREFAEEAEAIGYGGLAVAEQAACLAELL
jgi:hypothetical protein